jgi:hypothetical protein
MCGLASMFVCLVIIGSLGAVQSRVEGASLGIGIVLVISTLFNMASPLDEASRLKLIATDYSRTCLLPYRGRDPQWSSQVQDHHPRSIRLQPDWYLFQFGHSSNDPAPGGRRVGMGTSWCRILLCGYQPSLVDLVLVQAPRD